MAWCYTAKSKGAAGNTDWTRMFGELLEETSDLGLGYTKSLLLNGRVLFLMRYPAFGKSITKWFRTKKAETDWGAFSEIVYQCSLDLLDKMAHSESRQSAFQELFNSFLITLITKIRGCCISSSWDYLDHDQYLFRRRRRRRRTFLAFPH